LTIHRALAIGLIVSGLSCADTFVTNYEPAGVQLPDPALICVGRAGCLIGTETFDSWNGGGFTTDFGTGGLITGVYAGSFLSYAADQYGGAGGTGRYPELFSGGPYSVTLSAGSGVPGVNYFGLWLSALDAGNSIQFYENGTLVYSFMPADLIGLVGACTGSNPFCGNPSVNFNGQDAGEQFAYLNFYDLNGYFNQIVFSESGGGGLESDDHTVAYRPAPEPGSVALFGAGGILLALLARRRRPGPRP